MLAASCFAADYSSVEQWNGRRAELQRQILESAGLWPVPDRSGVPTERRYGRVERPGFAVEKLTLETIPGYVVAGNLYTPRGVAANGAAVLVPHGHWDGGRVEDQQVYSVPALAANLAAQGYVVFTWDMVGWNDTRQTPHDFGKDKAGRDAKFGPLGLQLWNSLRIFDWASRLPGVDPKRIAVTGASGGATQTFLLTAVEDRVAVSIPVDMISASFQGGCVCENAEGLRNGTSNVEFAAIAAPRPMLVVSTSQDWTRDVPKIEYPAIRRIYELYGKGENVANAHFHSPHGYDRPTREAAYAFLSRHLLNKPVDRMLETIMPGLTKTDLLIGDALDRTKLATYDQVLERWRAMKR